MKMKTKQKRGRGELSEKILGEKENGVERRNEKGKEKGGELSKKILGKKKNGVER